MKSDYWLLVYALRYWWSMLDHVGITMPKDFSTRTKKGVTVWIYIKTRYGVELAPHPLKGIFLITWREYVALVRFLLRRDFKVEEISHGKFRTYVALTRD